MEGVEREKDRQKKTQINNELSSICQGVVLQIV